MYYKDISYVILCGGMSTRMGEDKGSMNISNKPMIIHVLDSLNHIINEAIIVLNDEERIEKYQKIIKPEKYTYKIKYTTDEIPNKGPLSGIMTGLNNTNTKYAQILPCDSPYITQNFIKNMQKLLKQKKPTDAIIPYHTKEKTEPLHGIYQKKDTTTIKKLIQNEKLSIKEYLKQIKPYYIHIDNIKLEEINFNNLNTKEDIKKYEKK